MEPRSIILSFQPFISTHQTSNRMNRPMSNLHQIKQVFILTFQMRVENQRRGWLERYPLNDRTKPGLYTSKKNSGDVNASSGYNAINLVLPQGFFHRLHGNEDGKHFDLPTFRGWSPLESRFDRRRSSVPRPVLPYVIRTRVKRRRLLIL